MGAHRRHDLARLYAESVRVPGKLVIGQDKDFVFLFLSVRISSPILQAFLESFLRSIIEKLYISKSAIVNRKTEMVNDE